MVLETNPTGTSWLPIIAIVVIPLIFVCGFLAPAGWNWALVMFFMIVFVISLGKLKTESYFGIFINERKKMSLSRFQLVIWTLIVLSAFLTIALYNISAKIANPLEITIPPQLWYLLGISTTSLVGSPLVLSTKRKKTPIEEEVILFQERKGITAKTITTEITDNVTRFGTLDFNLKIEDAKFADMFMGDEIGNSGSIDMAKVQKFFFTLIIAFSYMLLLLNLIMNADSTGLSSFPALDDSLVALLGISSAGYLTNKTYDKTKTKKP